MVPLDEDSAPPPPAGDRDVVMSTASEPSPVTGAASVEDCWGIQENPSPSKR
jgi:hypothetical protein